LQGLPAGSVIALCDSAVLNGPAKGGDNLLGANSLAELAARDREALVKHMKKGGSVVLIAVKDPAKLAGMLGSDIQGSPMEGYWFDYKKVGGLTLGLSAGDLFWKDNMSLPLPDKKFPIWQADAGKGKLIVCQVDPLYFPDVQLNQRRDRSRQKMSRILSVLFGNLGVPSGMSSLDYLGTKYMDDIDITGEWRFRVDIDNKGLDNGWQKKEEWAKDYKPMQVPGSWESQGEYTPNPNVDGKEPYDGYAWYQKSVVIPSSAKGIQLYSEMNSVDDYDWTYFNGEQIGSIGKETPEWWAAKRFYAIPSNLINYDKPNTVTVRVFDNWQDGGILEKPDRVTCKKKPLELYLDYNIDDDLRYDPYYYYRW